MNKCIQLLKPTELLLQFYSADEFPSSVERQERPKLSFPVVMYSGESWTMRKAEHQRIDAFELWYW